MHAYTVYEYIPYHPGAYAILRYDGATFADSLQYRIIELRVIRAQYLNMHTIRVLHLLPRVIWGRRLDIPP